MRAIAVSLIALVVAAPSAWAQTTPDSTAPAPTAGATVTPGAAPATPSNATAPSATQPPPTPTAPSAGALEAVAPGAAPASPPAAAPEAAPAAPPAPPAPPPAPTDPTAIGLLSALDSVCVPAVSGGNMAQLTKAAGFRKSGDNYVLKRPTFQLTVLAPGANPTTCHVDIISPVDAQAPAAPLIVALHNWAAVTRGYTLYRNDKNVAGAQELTTRSWELSQGGKNQALVLTTYRKADGTPALGARETSSMFFSATSTPAG